MAIRERMKACIETLKERWIEEGFVRKGDELVRVRPMGCDRVLFTPPGSWRMDIQVFLRSWDVRVDTFRDARLVRWPVKRFKVPGAHFGGDVVKMMGEKGYYIGEKEAQKAGFGSAGLTDYIWSHAPAFTAWFEHHADPEWLTDELTRRAREHVHRYASDPSHDETNTWSERDFILPALYARLVGRDDLLPELKALHREAVAHRRGFGTRYWTEDRINADVHRTELTWTHLERCVRQGPHLLPPPGGTGVELPRWRRRRHVESLERSLQAAGFASKGAHKLARVRPHGLETVQFTPLEDQSSNGIQLTLGVWNAQLDAAENGTEVDWPKKRFRFPEAHESVLVAALMGLDHSVVEEADAEAAGFEGELDAYIWSFSDALMAWFASRGQPAWLAERLPDPEESGPPWWADDLERLLGPRLSGKDERAIIARFCEGSDRWAICEAALQECGGLKGKALERADALLHALLPTVDDLSELSSALDAFLAAKPRATLAGKVGAALSSIVLRREYLQYATGILLARKAPSTAALSLIRESLADWRVEDQAPDPMGVGLAVLMLQKTRAKGAATARTTLHVALRAWDPASDVDSEHQRTWLLEMSTPPAKYTGWEPWPEACLSRLSRAGRAQLLSACGGEENDNGHAVVPELTPEERTRLEASESAYLDAWLRSLS